jgi:competence protein ComEC
MQLMSAALGETWPSRLRLATALRDVLEAERGRLALWLPVCMAAGVAGYFALHSEPPAWAGAAIALPAVLGALWARARRLLQAVLAGVAAAAIGCTAAQFATLQAPPLERLPTHATVLTGIVLALDQLPEGRRITLISVSLDDLATTLRRTVRVRLRASDTVAVEAGDTVRVRALLQQPASPAFPGARDLQRAAFFGGLAGSGFALGPLTVVAQQPPAGLEPRIQALRDKIGRRIAAVLPGASGAIAATLLTGTGTAISESDRDAFRDSGLAHLLAVAGLHIGIVMGWVMLATRRALAVSERAALFWPCKQIAAITALAAGSCYMVLTGMHLPIMRSFAMATLFTVALLAGRRAVSLRGLAVAAVVLMLVTPQDVPGVSFQMSFSAVLALISGYEALRPRLSQLRGERSSGRRFALHVLALALTSLLAGGASAPFAAYHFGQVQVYFVLANVLAVPLTALLVMPAGLLALALMPFGLEWLALLPMGLGCEAILWVARTVSALPAATWLVPHMPLWGLGAVALGMA